ncbi:MAG: DNA-directed RNA polymerase subunit omega [Saprospiraceae bacterium]
MSDIKTRVQGIDPNVRARDIKKLASATSSIYETLCVITKRAEEISMDIKEELHGKLEEFASTSDTIEEILENKEQIEISKFYERLPNPIIIATEEFVNQELTYEYKEGEKVVEE